MTLTKVIAQKMQMLDRKDQPEEPALEEEEPIRQAANGLNQLSNMSMPAALFGSAAPLMVTHRGGFILHKTNHIAGDL